MTNTIDTILFDLDDTLIVEWKSADEAGSWEFRLSTQLMVSICRFGNKYPGNGSEKNYLS
jgi:FMN phosphatase YigB (HAD superfamily)